MKVNPNLRLRAMERADWAAVAALVHDSTNAWYEGHGMRAVFGAGPESTLLFCEQYEALDPGGCLLAEDAATGVLAGSCFWRQRDTHLALGIMNVAPAFFGRAVARTLLDAVIARADEAGLPLRLVSSALNLDSYALYTRAGFVPRAVYQDMVLPGGVEGIEAPGLERIRPARPDDLTAIVRLARELEGLDRGRDYTHFLADETDIWNVSVLEEPNGALAGAVASIAHPGSTMIGPGVAPTESDAAALILAELRHRAGHSPVVLVPAHCAELVATMYGWGARNVELHVHQCRGEWAAPAGVSIPTFMPESA
ncbi:MAG: GNAT family N-acetyltransferase [Planctomycetota bacterium]